MSESLHRPNGPSDSARNTEAPFTEAPFTEASYRSLLESLTEHFSFVDYGNESNSPQVVMRHDVDLSIHRALRMAEIEAEVGVSATYFLRIRSEGYNLLETACRRVGEQIVDLGHRIGLHYDYEEPLAGEALDRRVRADAEIVSTELGVPLRMIAFHNPVTSGTLNNFSEQIGGLYSAYARSVRDRYTYFSDSFGRWSCSEEPNRDYLTSRSISQVQFSLHPEWWVPGTHTVALMDRFRRAIEGRAAANIRWYEEFLKNYPGT